MAQLIADPVADNTFVAFFMHQEQALVFHIPVRGCGIDRPPQANNGDWDLAVIGPQPVGISHLYAELVRQALMRHGFNRIAFP